MREILTLTAAGEGEPPLEYRWGKGGFRHGSFDPSQIYCLRFCPAFLFAEIAVDIARASPNRTVQPRGANHIRNVVPNLRLFLSPLARGSWAAQRLHGGAICWAVSGHWPMMQDWPLLRKLRFCETACRRWRVTYVTPVGRRPAYVSQLGRAPPPATELRHIAGGAVRTKRAKRQSPRPPVRNLDTAGPGRSPTVGGVCIFRPLAAYPTGVGKSNRKPWRCRVDFQAVKYETHGFRPDYVAGWGLGEGPTPGSEGASAESVTRWEECGISSRLHTTPIPSRLIPARPRQNMGVMT